MDVEQINNFMSNADREEVSFSDAQWLFLPDSNQGSYQNILQFYTTPLKQQFIDYHNAYLRIPLAIEYLNSVPDSTNGAVAAVNHRPPTSAFRDSVLSLFSNINISTDQGQTIVNDINTQFINNIRLNVENDEGWIRTEGSYLDYSYDRFNMFPSQNTAVNSAGYTTVAQTSPSYFAAQGIEPGFLPNPSSGTPLAGAQLSGAPLVNDPNQYGNNTLGSLQFGVYTAAALTTTGVQPVLTFNQAQWTGNSATAPTSGYLGGVMSDGRIVSIAFTSTTATASGGVLTLPVAGVTSLGGVDITTTIVNAQATSGAIFALQAVGYTNVLDQPLDSELVTLPLTFTGSSTSGNFVLTSFGGVPTTTIVVVPGLVAQLYGQVAGLNPNCNKGFLDRITFIQNASEYVFTPAAPSGSPVATTPQGQAAPNGAHTYYYRCVIPLKLIHDFFRQLDFPIINVGFNFQFTFAQSYGSNISYVYPPMQTSNNTYLLTGGADNTPYPSLWYGRNMSGQEGTRLYYRVVKFSPADNARAAEKLTTGFTKSVKFISCDWFREPVPVAVGTSTHQFQFSTSVVHPLRVWVLPYPYLTYVAGSGGTVANPTISSSAREAMTDPTFTPSVITGLYTQCNILINNIPYFRQNFQNFDDLWEQLREQFDPDNGSMISYNDFRNYRRTLCFDLTRIADRLQSPTEVS